MERRFGLEAGTLSFQPTYNAAPGQTLPVIVPVANGRTLGLMRWGLVPSWARDEKIGYKLINARSETASKQPSFRAALRERRCLVPANWFYEWKGDRGAKTPHVIRRRDGGLFAMAGLYETTDARFRLATTEEFGPVHIERGKVGPSPAALILVFDLPCRAGSRGVAGVAAACLDTGLLVGRKHELIGLQRLSLPDSVIEIEEPAGRPRAGGIPRKQPAAVLPGADGVFVEPAPDGAARQAGHQAGPAGMASQFSAPTRQGAVPPRGQFTGQGLDLDDHLRGGRPAAGRGVDAPRDLRDAARRNVCATDRRPRVGSGDVRRFPGWKGPEQPARSSGPGQPENTTTYTSRLGALTHGLRPERARYRRGSCEARGTPPRATVPDESEICNASIR